MRVFVIEEMMMIEIKSCWLVLYVLCFGDLMIVLDLSIVNVVLLLI